MTTIVTRQLDCGMTLLVEPMSGVRSAGLSWMLPCGCAHDAIDRQGRATMWGELLMRGAGDMGSRDHADAFDRLGASRATDVGTTTLRISATILGARLLEGLPLVVDMALRPRMDPDSIEPVRDLAQQALAGLKDDPQQWVMLLARAHHHPSPRDRSGLGTQEGLAALTRDDLVSGWRETCRPGGSVLAVAGAVDANAVARRLDELFVGWGGETRDPPTGAVPARGYHHEHHDTNQVQIVVVQDAPPEPDETSVLERLAVSVLSGGMSGRLFSEVREKRGLCYSVNAGYRGEKDYGVLSAYVGTTPERAQESLDVLLGELDRIGRPGGEVTREEFDRAITGIKSGLIFSGESTSARAAALAGDHRRLGRGRTLDEIAAKYDAITLDGLNDYLARRTAGKITIQTLGPQALRWSNNTPA